MMKIILESRKVSYHTSREFI